MDAAAGILAPVEEARRRLGDERAEAERRASAGALTRADVDAFKVRWLGQKQGAVTGLLARIREVPKEEKARFGEAVNALKREAEAAVEALLGSATAADRQAKEQALAVDVTLPPRIPPAGRLHPLTVVRRKLEDAFRTLGYEVADGPEIETDWHNFGALNFPADHPARDAFDTFFVKDGEAGTSGCSSGHTPRPSRSGRCSPGSPRSGS